MMSEIQSRYLHAAIIVCQEEASLAADCDLVTKSLCTSAVHREPKRCPAALLLVAPMTVISAGSLFRGMLAVCKNANVMSQCINNV